MLNSLLEKITLKTLKKATSIYSLFFMQSLNSTSLIEGLLPSFGVILNVMFLASLYIRSWKSGVALSIGEASLLSSMIKDPDCVPSGIYNIKYIIYYRPLNKII